MRDAVVFLEVFLVQIVVALRVLVFLLDHIFGLQRQELFVVELLTLLAVLLEVSLIHLQPLIECNVLSKSVDSL